MTSTERPPASAVRLATQLVAEALMDQYPGLDAAPEESDRDEPATGAHLLAADERDIESVLYDRILRAREGR
jgi:hypothetical protein